jgi:hypothetical protein
VGGCKGGGDADSQCQTGSRGRENGNSVHARL